MRSNIFLWRRSLARVSDTPRENAFFYLLPLIWAAHHLVCAVSLWGSLTSNHRLSDSRAAAAHQRQKSAQRERLCWLREGVMNWCFISALHAALGEKKRRRVSYEAELVTPWTWRMWHIREQLVRKRCITLAPLTTTLPTRDHCSPN